MNHVTRVNHVDRGELVILNSRTSSSCFKSIKIITTRSTYRNSGLNESNDEAEDTNEETLDEAQDETEEAFESDLV